MSFLLVFWSFEFLSKCSNLYTWWFLNSDQQNDGKISPLERQSLRDSERLCASHWGEHMTSVLIVICNALDMTSKFRTHQVSCYYFSIMMTSSSFAMYKAQHQNFLSSNSFEFWHNFAFYLFAALHLVCKNQLYVSDVQFPILRTDNGFTQILSRCNRDLHIEAWCEVCLQMETKLRCNHNYWTCKVEEFFFTVSKLCCLQPMCSRENLSFKSGIFPWASRNLSLKVDAKCPWNLHFAGRGEASDNKFIPTNQHRQSSFMQSSQQLSHHHHLLLLVLSKTAIAILQLSCSQHLHRFL